MSFYVFSALLGHLGIIAPSLELERQLPLQTAILQMEEERAALGRGAAIKMRIGRCR
jgi:hypothetical protein